MRYCTFILTFFVFFYTNSYAEQVAPHIKFIALGDAPYGDPAKVHKPYRSLIQNINKADSPLVIHIGDTHGHNTCDDALVDQLRGYMNEFNSPVLYTPGDNEWTDCKKTDVGNFDPLERLAYIRKTHFQNGRTLGRKTLPVENQAKNGYPENARLLLNNIGFVSVHVVGSNNNFNPYDMVAINEFVERNKANVAWLSESFEVFKDAEAIVIALHADMFQPLSGFKKGWWPHSPFREIGLTIGRRSSALKKPVLLVYGDSHVHKAFQPFPEIRPYFHAIEVYGYPDIKAIEIAVQPDAKNPFTVTRVFEP